MGQRVLIVDSDIEARNTFYEILSSLNYEPTCVPTAKEALNRLTEERFDLIILERDMPDLDGVDIVRKIREFDKDTKIVLLSREDPERSILSLAHQLNIQRVLKKDFSTHMMMRDILGTLREKRSSPQPSSLFKNFSILIVDDNPQVRETLQIFLEKKGFKVLTASSGEDAVMKVKLGEPKVVILDIRMPGMDGVVVLRNIKQLNPSIKVIVLTSVRDDYIMKEARREGASEYLVKPYDLEKLDNIITSLLLQKRSEDG
ncbi:MAG: response regulator [Candidatus Omnitrophica bacterium]|nr:response regulator [Candidatus Omnitrophota bacterium]